MIKELNENLIGKIVYIKIPYDSIPKNTIAEIVGVCNNNRDRDDTYINEKWYKYDIILKKIEKFDYGYIKFIFHGCSSNSFNYKMKKNLDCNLPVYYYAPHHVLELISNN